MIYLTPKAAEKATSYLKTQERAIGLRFGVKDSGCSNMSYVVEAAEQQLPNDQVFEDKGVKIYVETQNLKYLDGTTMDWHTKGLNQGYAFLNPNETASCGCGESFTIDNKYI